MEPRPGPEAAPRVVRNTRPGVDWNTCGQAAIATVLAHSRLGPFAAGVPVTDGEAIDWVKREFPGDLPLGLGTTAFRLAAALRALGLGAERVHSGWFERDAARALERLVTHVRARHPVPVCIDIGRLGGPIGAGHWAVAVAFEDDRIWLGNAGLEAPLSRERFVELWRCRWFPYGHNHAAVLAWT
jgi:hypothetical protein